MDTGAGVILLDSLLKYRVVPSVILWLSPDNFIYVLDGGHRMSVLLAYMEDDWGDKGLQHLPLAQIEATRRIADEVRRLMTQRQLASFKDHQDANATYWRLSEQENGDKAAIKSQMNPREWELALRYRGWVPQSLSS